MLGRFLNLFKIPDLRNKILFVGFLFIAFRLLAAIPIPGIDITRLQQFFASNQLFDFFNVFSGGTLSNLSIMMLGVGPYITGTIIMQLLTMIVPSLKKLYYEEGAIGRAKFNRISRYITVPLAGLQAYGFLNLLRSEQVLGQLAPFDMIRNIAVITAGTVILMWIGELITEKKIGNGISLIIFAGIVSAIPQVIQRAIVAYDPSTIPTYGAFLILGIIIIAGVVFVNQGERKIPVTYAKRVRGNKVVGGATTYLPLRVNQAGVIPIIFAISILLFPNFIAQISAIFSETLSLKMQDIIAKILNDQLIYGALYFFLVFAFTYFYTAITFDPKEIAKNLQQSGGFIPGIRPGDQTALYLNNVTNRITLFGAIFLGFVAILPTITSAITGIATLTIGGTTLLIVVSVVLETIKQLDAQLVMREYEGIK